ncbi:60 kDa SS-A/Ro ribonucleoprotein-like [Anopheles stephensi]|uniref:60 kDa SS-A/Ro ribonucleoprotein-like n=1 Tax=Anopheles stephensi TaxID=30069 RepID=UPI00165899E4|nr:60 kDa SS-A/Ro ribonucleoprotein-like [Anopheles stephensi]
MDSVLNTVQRFLYIGSDIPFVFDPPPPLDLELGKQVLGPAVNPVDPAGAGKQPEPPVTTEGPAHKKTGNKKKDNQTIKLEVEKAKQQQTKNNKPETPKAAAAAATESKSLTSKPVETVATAVLPLHPVLALIKSTFKSKSLRRTDECLFALAYCARNFATPEDRHAVYVLLPELIRTSHDLLTFISYFTQLATQSGHAGFGHGLRTAITRWYEKFTPIDLAEMLVRSISTAGWTHKDVIAKAHPKLNCVEKQALLDAAMKRTSQLQEKKAPEKKGKKKKQKETVAPPAPALPATKETAVAVSSSKAFRRYQTLLQFKSVPNAGKALELLKQHGAKGRLELLPRHLRRFAKVWEALYPYLTYRELLQAALPMHDFRLLKEGDANTKAYVETLKKRLDALEAECIHPIEVFVIAKLYQHGKRYVTKVKEEMHTLYLTDMCPPLKEVQDRLNEALEHSLSHHPKTGVRYYIALDLRCVYDRKKIFRNQVITCFQASVLLAFSIYKREKNVTVVAFTEDKEALASVEFEPSMTLEQAMKLCVGLMLPTTKVSLEAPIKQAEASKLKVDVFITVTDSLIRVNPTRRPPTAQLQEYRKKMKLNLSRYVAISLTHHTPSLDWTGPGKDTGGLLEMVGYSAHNAKVIEAFAKNNFF